MVDLEEKQYAKAYVELNEIINHLPKEEQDKIPENFKNNLLKYMDSEYSFIYDNNKSILEQDYMVETKSLYINLYRKYLTQEVEFWKKYDQICLNIIEKEKREKYNSDNIFSNNIFDSKNVSNNENATITVLKDENFIEKLINKIRKIFLKNKN